MHYAIVKVQFSFFMSNNFVRLHTKFNFALPGKVMEHKIGKKLLFNKTAIVLNQNLLETTIVQKKNEWNNFLLICKKPKVFFHFSKQSKSFVNRFFSERHYLSRKIWIKKSCSFTKTMPISMRIAYLIILIKLFWKKPKIF